MAHALSRRELLALSAAGLTCPDAFALQPNHGEMMWDYFAKELGAADQKRRKAMAAIRSKTDLDALQEKVRRVMKTGIGTFPERTPLRVRQTGELRKSDYVIEKIIFESRPEYYVTANLYRPAAGGGRRPAVVQSCGHYEEGKAAPDYQRACIGLAKLGFVALIFDPMGQGERWMFRKPGEKRPSATSEHSLAGKPTLLLGRTLAHYRMWDLMRALDYLESRPDVDPARMGLLGHSGGGMMTILTSPLEPRIRAAMSCCAVTSFYYKTMGLLMADPEQIVPGIYANGVDHPEMIATVAPRAFLIGAVLRDFVPLEGTRRTFEETKHIYEMLGVPDNFAKVESDNTHMLDQNLREACYAWMRKHLAGEHGKVREPEMQPETEEDLRCTKTGSVMDLEKARSVFDLNLTCSHELQRGRALQKASTEAGARTLLALPRSMEPEAGIEVPATRVEGSRGRDALLIVATPRGRKSDAAQELTRSFTGAGYSVLGVDLRGWGETTCTRAKKERFDWDEFFAWRTIEMGRPLVGMRVRDLVAVARTATQYRKVYVVGIEAGGIVALHAAALEPSIAGVATLRTLGSYQSVIDELHSPEPVSSLVWGALTTYDLPELARAIQPRPCVMAQHANEILRGLQL